MKRTWRPGRLLLAMLLMSVAVLAAYYWPKKPRWQLSTDMTRESYHLLQVDERNRHLYLRYLDFSGITTALTNAQHTGPFFTSEIRCYALDSGELLWSKPDPEEGKSRRPLDEFTRFGDVILSPDLKQVAYLKNGKGEIHLYDFPSLTGPTVIKYHGLSPAEHINANYSPQGDLLLTRIDKQIFIYDSKSASLIYQLDIPRERVQSGGRGNWVLAQDALICSPDKKYLITANNMADNILVFDIASKKVIGECPSLHLPRVLGDGKTLLCFPDYFHDHSQAHWYRLNDHDIKAQTTNKSEKIKGSYLCCTDKYFFTSQTKESTSIPAFWQEWPWLSDSFKMNLARWLGLWNIPLEVSVWRNDTGTLERRFPLVIAVEGMLPSSGQRNWISMDGSQFLFNIGSSIALWDVPPSIPSACWGVITGVTLFSLWLAWPRRMKIITLA